MRAVARGEKTPAPNDPLSGADLQRYTSAMYGNSLRLACAGGWLACVALGACAALGPGPVVTELDRGLGEANLARVAVLPFSSAIRDGGTGSASVANQVAVALGEDLAGAGIAVVAPGEVEAVVAARGDSISSADPTAAVRLAAELDATAVVLGRLTRFRDRVGSAAGATVSASVAFEVFVHEVPSGRRLWIGRFDETQASLSADVLRARRLPGGGSRWLSGQELARWGAAQTASAITSRSQNPAR